jgi:hypothetical protein
MPYKDPEKRRQYRIRNREKILAWKRASYVRNRKSIIAKQRNYVKNNPEVERRYRKKNKKSLSIRKSKAYYSKLEENRRKSRDRATVYRQLNRETKNSNAVKYAKKKRATDLAYRLKDNLRRRIRKVLTAAGVRKSNRTHELLGCSPSFFREHIESLFTDGINWSNYGEVWQIDHIKPLALFDLRDVEQQKLAFNFRNCRPLDKLTNIRLGCKLRKYENKYKITAT